MSLFQLFSRQSFQTEYLAHFRTLETSKKVVDSMQKYLSSCDFEEDTRRLQNGIYPFSAPAEKKLFFGREEKLRIVWSFSRRETNLQRLMVYALHKYDSKFSDCVQNGLKKYAHWETRLRKVNNYGELTYFTTDLHNCYNSISRGLLLKKLDEFIDDDPVLLKVLKEFVQNSQCIVNDRLSSDRSAVPAGSPLSCFLVNVFLREIDFNIEPEADFYARQTDHIVIGCLDPLRVRKLGETALGIINDLGLQVNEDETMFLRPGEPLDLHGRRVTGKEIDFSPDNLKTMKKSLRRTATWAKKELHGLKPEAKAFLCMHWLDTSQAYRYLRKSFLSLTTDRSYKELDRYMQNLLREVITGKSGSGKYVCTYQDLQSYGYRSLTGQYYKFLEQGRQLYESNY